jgi:opacity protein-like surface antigen
MNRRTALALICALASPLAFAEAQEQHVEQSIVVNARLADVWAIAGDFVGLPRWYPPIESSRLVLGVNNVPGAIRQLTRANGTRVEEKLLDYEWQHSLTYTYAGGQVMSSDYFATLSVEPLAGDKTKVLWKARFKRLAYWTDEPPPGQDDDTVRNALNKGYKLGLERLKALAEGTAD